MRFDVENQLCVAQAFTGSATVSSNSYMKQSADQDIAIGRRMGLMCIVTTAAGSGSTHTMEVIEAKDRIIMYFEFSNLMRQIYMDGREHPKDLVPSYMGHSIGRWEGDTLVVDSIGFLDNAWIDENGSPLSNEAHVTERIRRPNYGTLEIQITVTDPKMYKEPWTVTANQRLMADDELIEFICGENNTNLPHLVTK